MDIINPDLIWIGTRCYRINQQTSTYLEKSAPTLAPYVEDFEDDCQEEYEIEEKNGKFYTTFHVPHQFFAQIIGTKGQTRRRLESDTKTRIFVPKQGDTKSDLRIEGSSRDQVSSARRRIELLVLGGRSKLQFTHFLSVQMAEEEIKKSFLAFKDVVLGEQPFGLDENYFQKPEKLHLTLNTFTLLDNEDRAQAAELLQECRDLIVQPIAGGPIEIRMEGLEIMNDDPAEVNVLYGKVDCPKLQEIADQMNEFFASKGMIQKKYDSIKLHVTLINSIFGENDENAEKKMFDMRKVLEKYGDFRFGRILVKEIHLSQRYSTGSNGYYEASSIIKL